MKPFLFLATRSDDEPADAEYEAFLKRTGLNESTLVRLRLESRPLPQIDLDDWSGILVGGSPFNASTPAEKKSATQKRVEAELSGLLDRVVAADFPFFGACYGVGTLACHQGAVVDTTYGEAVTELPPHAVVLGTGRACPVQIFRIKSNLYATQFHPELDGDYLAHRLGFYSGHGYFADDELAELQARVRLDDVSDSWKLLANFVAVHARD